ncbi:MAG: UDP-glucose 4-epimerase GalE [Oscillospiraceae bacterium]|jgi:UDP-glucose 4-epimerase|nr:UDP-glucose 4-epimerase GalE [Oscillospiraceae bacterium]
MRILVTGGAGYIGSHTCLELLEGGHEVFVLDNLCNSSVEAIKRVKELSGKSFEFFNCDIRDKSGLRAVFTKARPEAVIHFAGLKAVGESCEKPLEYYDNNLGGTVCLCEVMQEFGLKNIVFSSSATVYGRNEPPLSEDMPTGDCSNPYGRTKYMIEELLKDIYASDNSWNIILLRYFNPIGAHKSGRIGENPKGIPNNLMPYLSQVAVGKLAELSIFGDDYETPDGTCIRDYIHVVDLAKGHLCAINRLEQSKGLEVFNLGTGHGYSVLDIVKAFIGTTGVNLPYKITPRRAGDLAAVYSNSQKATELLGWSAQYGIERMCEDTWRWQSNNPTGYED